MTKIGLIISIIGLMITSGIAGAFICMYIINHKVYGGFVYPILDAENPEDSIVFSITKECRDNILRGRVNNIELKVEAPLTINKTLK